MLYYVIPYSFFTSYFSTQYCVLGGVGVLEFVINRPVRYDMFIPSLYWRHGDGVSKHRHNQDHLLFFSPRSKATKLLASFLPHFTPQHI